MGRSEHHLTWLFERAKWTMDILGNSFENSFVIVEIHFGNVVFLELEQLSTCIVFRYA